MSDDPGLSRRRFLAATASAAALAALEACSSSGPHRAAAGRARTRRRRRPRPCRARRASGPTPRKAEGADLLPEIEHIVVVMQENHSYDNYFGMLGRGDGFTLDATASRPTAIPTRTASRSRAFHMANTCQPACGAARTGTPRTSSGTTARSTDSSAARRARPRWATGTAPTCPSTTALANTFPVCDRWFASVLGQTYPEPAVPAVRLGARQRQHDRRPRATCPRRRTARSSRRSTVTTSPGATTTPALPVAVPVPARRSRSQRRQVPEDRPVLRRRRGRQAARRSASSSRTATTQSEEDPAGHLARRGVHREGHQRGDAQPELAEDACWCSATTSTAATTTTSPPPQAVAPDDIAPILTSTPGPPRRTPGAVRATTTATASGCRP